MTTATKPAAETLAEIADAIELTKLKLVNLNRDLDAARTEAVTSGAVGNTSPRVKQLAKKVDEAEVRIAELEEEQLIAQRLAHQEAEAETRARIEELKAEASRRNTEETKAWELARDAFAEFVTAASAWATVAQGTIELRRQTAHEFAHRRELEELLAVLRPYVNPLACDVNDVTYLMASVVDTTGVRVKAHGTLDRVNRHGEPAWGSEPSWTTNFA